MKKAVIQSGGKQYLVSVGDELSVELLNSPNKTAEFEALLVVDGDNISIGKPVLDKVKVVADVINSDVQTDKVTSIRFKAKKRVKKVRGHRQRKTLIKIKTIS